MPVSCASREDGVTQTHPDEEELARFFRGELPPSAARLVVRHLLTRCPRCSQVTRRLWKLGDGGAGSDGEKEIEGEGEGEE